MVAKGRGERMGRVIKGGGEGERGYGREENEKKRYEERYRHVYK